MALMGCREEIDHGGCDRHGNHYYWRNRKEKQDLREEKGQEQEHQHYYYEEEERKLEDEHGYYISHIGDVDLCRLPRAH